MLAFLLVSRLANCPGLTGNSEPVVVTVIDDIPRKPHTTHVNNFKPSGQRLTKHIQLYVLPCLSKMLDTEVKMRLLLTQPSETKARDSDNAVIGAQVRETPHCVW